MRRLIAPIILLAIAGVALFAWRSHGPTIAKAIVPTTQPLAATQATRFESVARKVPEKPVAAEPSIAGAFAEIRPELERRALDGDAVAARRLGMTLANCNHFEDVPDSKLEEIVVEQAARGFTAKIGGHDASPDEVLALYKLGIQQKRRDCKGVSGLDEAEGWKHAGQWLGRAAALGDPDAQALFGAFAFVDFDARDALVDAEKMRDRAQLAIDYLKHSLAQGDALALLQTAERYRDGLLFPVDSEKSYAYTVAYSLTPRASDFVPGLIDALLALRAMPLDEAARERALAEARRLSACCSAVPNESP